MIETDYTVEYEIFDIAIEAGLRHCCVYCNEAPYGAELCDGGEQLGGYTATAGQDTAAVVEQDCGCPSRRS